MCYSRFSRNREYGNLCFSDYRKYNGSIPISRSSLSLQQTQKTSFGLQKSEIKKEYGGMFSEIAPDKDR
jgi:hypothetical protein